MLGQLCADGCTNLAGGLLRGLAEAEASEAAAASVLLFTDGLANVGLTDTCAHASVVVV